MNMPIIQLQLENYQKAYEKTKEESNSKIKLSLHVMKEIRKEKRRITFL